MGAAGGGGAACRGPPRLSFESRVCRTGEAAPGAEGSGIPLVSPHPNSLLYRPEQRVVGDAFGFVVGMRRGEAGEAVALEWDTGKAGKLAG